MNNIKISNISNKKKIVVPKDLKYSEIMKFNSAMKVEKITINKWLKNYGLDKYHCYFGNGVCKKDDPDFNSYNLRLLKNNVDLINIYNDVEDFIYNIKPLVKKYNNYLLYNSKLKITYEEAINNIKYDLYRFYIAFNFLKDQSRDYKKLSSILGEDANNTQYKKMLQNTFFLNFLETKKYIEKKIFKEEIIEKLKLLDFDDFLDMSSCIKLRKFLSVDIDLLNSFNIITKNKLINIKYNCNESMTKKQYDKFIDNNKALEYLVSCDNLNDLNTMKDKLKELTPKELLELNRINIFSILIRPLNLIDLYIARKIYNFIFPSQSDFVIFKRLEPLNEIPKNNLYQNIKKKTRIFFLNAHGLNCHLEDYKDSDRYNIKKFIGDYNNSKNTRHRYTNITLFNNQPLGRLSLLGGLIPFNDIFSSFFREKLIKSMLNSFKKEHLNIIDSLLNIYIYKYFYSLNDINSKKDFEEYLLKFESSAKKPTWNQKNLYYGKTNFTTENLVNLTKYNYKNPPPNSTFSFNQNFKDEPMLGLFELNRDNEATIKNMDNLIKKKSIIDKDIKLGLKPELLYNFRSDIPNDYEEVFKYNIKIKELNKSNYNIGDFLKIIIENANIKNDEEIIILFNHCRGFVYDKKKTIKKHLNTYFHFDTEQKKKINSLRRNSINRATNTFKPSHYPWWYTPTSKVKSKKKRRKRGTRRKEAKRSLI